VPSIRSNRVVLGDEVRPASVEHSGGKIVRIADGPADVDLGDLVLMPGLVDTHVHVNDPGRSDWEGFETATRAGAAGGSTTIVDMPLNSIPPTVDRAALETKRRSARGRLAVDVGFWGGLIPGSGPALSSLAESGVCGFKAFLVDSGVPEFPALTTDELSRDLPLLAGVGLPLLVHAEDSLLLTPIHGDPTIYRNYLDSRPAEAEASAVASLAALTAGTQVRVHLVHLSSAEAVTALAAGPLTMSGETCPHYLTFDSGEIEAGATPFKCAPPIRDAHHRESLWDALGEGVISMVVSDHSPAPADLKAVESGDFQRSWGGIASLELRLPATWTGALQRGFSLADVARWLATAPAGLAGLGSKGSIAEGMDADLVVFDPDGVTRVRGEELRQRHPITPYEGRSLRGAVVSTVLRGRTVFDDDVVIEGVGQMVVPS
jgi:allantoinase